MAEAPRPISARAAAVDCGAEKEAPNKGMKQTKSTLWHNGRVAFAAYAQRSADKGKKRRE